MPTTSTQTRHQKLLPSSTKENIQPQSNDNEMQSQSILLRQPMKRGSEKHETSSSCSACEMNFNELKSMIRNMAANQEKLFTELKTEINSLKQQVKALKESPVNTVGNMFNLLPKFPIANKEDFLKFDVQLGENEDIRNQLVRLIPYITGCV